MILSVVGTLSFQNEVRQTNLDTVHILLDTWDGKIISEIFLATSFSFLSVGQKK